jgi:S1-C subfamily serine protease
MLVVDLIVLLLLVAAVAGGAVRGFIASIGMLVGLAAGGAAAYWLGPLIGGAIPLPSWRAVAVIGASILLLALGAGLGSALGLAVRRGVDRAAPLRVLDRILGAAASLVIAALAVSLVGSSIATTGIPTVSPAVASSRVLRTIDALVPPPVASGLAELRGTVLSEGLPQLGTLFSPQPAPSQPPVSLSDPQLTAAAASVARISGVAYSCGMSITGSGFVIADDELVTNAHVVAGVVRPIVELPGRPAVEGRVVYFDPADDLAVVRVDGLEARALRVSAPLAAGNSAVVAGYPYGGPFTMGDARVLDRGIVSVPDIYDENDHPRDVYSIQGTVKPGNSGGPMLTAAGTVAGVVFARAENAADRGYVMTSAVLAPVVAKAPKLTAAVSSGRCTH